MPAKDGFELQQSDVELLHDVFRLRLATIDHLAALSGRSVRALWGRLLKLRERRYLSSAARILQKHVYSIGPEAVPVLIEHGFAPRDFAERRLRFRELKDIGIRHSLFVADVHARLIVLTRTGPIALSRWREGSSLWDSAVVGGVPIPVRPDAAFSLKHIERPEGKNTRHFFLEADRSTMAHSRMALKISGFLAYYEQGLYARKHVGMQSFTVAVITQTRQRADELRKSLHPMIPHAAWRDAYIFIAFQDLTLEALLPKPAATKDA